MEPCRRPRARPRRALGGLALAALLLGSASPAAGAAPALSTAQIAALGGHLQPWQVAWLETGGTSALPIGNIPAPPDPASATYAIGGQDVTLRGGTASAPLTPGSLYVATTALAGPTVSGDLSRGGLPDVATVLARTGPHGGTAAFLAVLRGAPPGAVAPTAPLGNNVTVAWLQITGGLVLAETAPAGGGPEELRAYRLEGGALRMAPAPRTAVASWSPTGFQPTATESGTCAGASRVAPRPGAYRCTAGGALLDPCFALPGAPAVACPLGDPAAESGVRLDLATPLPPDAPAGRASAPWAFTLLGGGVCPAPVGTPERPHHPYPCSVPGASAAAQILHCTVPASAGPAQEAASCAAATGTPGPLGPGRPKVVAQAWF